MLPFPLSGRTLVVGPSNVGKTQLTAQALDQWVATQGTQGVVVLEFAPEVKRGGRILGGRLTRFTTVPDDVFHGAIEAYAPRSEADSDDEALNFARANAEHGLAVIDAAPDDPTAVFVNDATIPFQADATQVSDLTHYCDRATVAVLNAFDGTELGVDNTVSRQEQETLARLRSWADRVVPLN